MKFDVRFNQRSSAFYHQVPTYVVHLQYERVPIKTKEMMGSGCGSVDRGRAVASDTRGPRFESSHQRIFM